MTVLLSDADVRQAMDYSAVVESIETELKSAAAGGAAVPGRINLATETGWMRIMPAILPAAGVMGLKVFHGVRGHGVRYVVLLYSAATGDVLATMDAKYLTAARTAATSAVGLRYLAEPGRARVGVIGSGLEAATHCRAFAATTEIDEIKVFSPHPGRRNSFAERMNAELSVPVTACESAPAAVSEADLVVAATNTGASQAIALRGGWLRPGQHVTAIGSTNTDLRELDAEVFRRADVTVFDADPAHIATESGDVMQYVAEGGSLSGIGTLTDLIGGRCTGRLNSDQITLFKSVGTALQDLAAAHLVYRRAVELGLGTTVPDICSEKIFDSSLAVTSEH